MTNFKIIENKSKIILKYQDHIFKFNNTVNTRGQGTLWSCAIEKCRAFVKVNYDRSKIVESNEKHEHAMSSNAGKRDSDISSPRTPTSSKESDVGEIVLISPEKKTTKEEKKKTEGNAQQNDNKNKAQLPFNQSIISVATPGLNAAFTNDSTYEETPRARDEVGELKKQVEGLIQEIINKQLEIDRLNEKSKADEKDMEDMIRTIRILEGVKSINTNKNSRKQDQNITASSSKAKQIERTDSNVASPNNHTLKKLEPVNTRNVSRIGIFGDSHVRNLWEQLQKELQGNFHVHAHFKPGGTFQVIADMFTEEDMKYDHIFVIAGTNDICHSTWTEVVNAIYQISAKMKNKKIHLILPPPRGEKTTMNQYIKTFNQSIKQLTFSLDNVNCVDISYLLQYQHYAYDKLHLNRIGKIRLCRKIKQIIYNEKRRFSNVFENNNNNHISRAHKNNDRRTHFNNNGYRGNDEYKSRYFRRSFCRRENVGTNAASGYNKHKSRGTHLGGHFSQTYKNHFQKKLCNQDTFLSIL